MTLPALGLDIARLKFNACLVTAAGKLRHKVFPNMAGGFAQLTGWLTKQGTPRTHASMEATGSYGEALALYLRDAGHTVSVVNPAAVEAYAQSRLSRTKTDKADAELVARFCLAQRPPAWSPPAPEVRELQALARRLESLVGMRVAEENRLTSGVTVEAVRRSVEEHVAYLNEQIRNTGGESASTSTATRRSGGRANCSTPSPASARRPPPHCWPGSRTLSSTGARARWRPTPVRCRASGAVVARYAGGCGCQRSATPACDARSTSRR